MWTSAEILELAQSQGFDPVGICRAEELADFSALATWVNEGKHGSMAYMERHLEARRHPHSILPGAKSILMVGLNTYRPVEHVEGQPRIARYALARDYHIVMRKKLKRVVRELVQRTPSIQTRICVDSAPLLERSYANRAGLGWFGKNTMLISSRIGSWFMLGAVLLDVELDPSQPAEGGCGTCRACVDACPTGAIVNSSGRWQVDARQCISMWTIEHRGDIPVELHAGIGDWTFGCDVCQDVCPFNQPRASQPLRAPETQDPDWGPVRQWPNLEQLVQWPESDWDKTTQGSAVRRAGHRGLLRNARINLSSQSK